MSTRLRLPPAPKTILAGSTLKNLLDREAVECLAHNVSSVYPRLRADDFRRTAMEGLAPLSVTQRGDHIAKALHAHLPKRYEQAEEMVPGTNPSRLVPQEGLDGGGGSC